MELAKLLNQIEKQEIKKGNPIEVTVYAERECDSGEKFKAIGYFDNLYTKGYRTEPDGPVLDIKKYKGHEKISGMGYDSNSFLVSNLIRIRKLG
jgi:hypothetical protein